VLDAFCAGIPMITTDSALHGPEIAYLESGRNGFVVSADARAFADAYLQAIEPARFAAIRQAAFRDAQRYTLDNMVERFIEGIEKCLTTPRLRYS
jgi:glycosyltransferase involved in cell wall biosynthesis